MLALSKKRTTMKKILLFALMTFFVQTSFCQNLSDTVNVEYSKNSPERLLLGFGAPGFGYTWALSPNLNSFLESNNIESKNLILSVPLNLIYQHNRLKIGLEAVYGLPRARESQAKYSSSLNVRIESLSFGYAIVADRNYFLYLNFGAGHAEYTRTIDIKAPQTTSLSSALQSGTGQSVVLKNSGAFLDFSLETLIRTKKAKALGNSIKIGYRYGLEENPWNSTFNSFTDIPSDRVSNFYMQFIFTLPYLSWIGSDDSNNKKR
jgi:hypothetical protein